MTLYYIVLVVASSRISAHLLLGGRTTHLRFLSTRKSFRECNMYMKQGTQLAELISLTSLIIWDEVPMNHRYAFEAVDKSLEDILSISDPSLKNTPFGGKTIYFLEEISDKYCLFQMGEDKILNWAPSIDPIYGIIVKFFSLPKT